MKIGPFVVFFLVFLRCDGKDNECLKCQIKNNKAQRNILSEVFSMESEPKFEVLKVKHLSLKNVRNARRDFRSARSARSSDVRETASDPGMPWFMKEGAIGDDEASTASESKSVATHLGLTRLDNPDPVIAEIYERNVRTIPLVQPVEDLAVEHVREGGAVTTNSYFRRRCSRHKPFFSVLTLVLVGVAITLLTVFGLDDPPSTKSDTGDTSDVCEHCWCGEDFEDSRYCMTPCTSRNSNECPQGQTCHSNILFCATNASFEVLNSMIDPIGHEK